MRKRFRFAGKHLEEQPNMVEARYLLAIVLTQQDRTWEASQELETVLDAKPGTRRRHPRPGRDLLCGARSTNAPCRICAISRGRNADDDGGAGAAGRLLRTAWPAGRGARRLRAPAPACVPNSVEVCVNLGRVLAGSGRARRSAGMLHGGHQARPDVWQRLLQRGRPDVPIGHLRPGGGNLSGRPGSQTPTQEGGFFVLGNCYFRTAGVCRRRRLVPAGACASSPPIRKRAKICELAEQRALEVGQEVPAA